MKFIPIIVATRQQFEQDNLLMVDDLEEGTVYKTNYEGIIQFPLLQDIPMFLDTECIGLVKVVSVHQFPLKNATVAEYCLSQDLSADQRELFTIAYGELSQTFKPTHEKKIPAAKKQPRTFGKSQHEDDD